MCILLADCVCCSAHIVWFILMSQQFAVNNLFFVFFSTNVKLIKMKKAGLRRRSTLSLSKQCSNCIYANVHFFSWLEKKNSPKFLETLTIYFKHSYSIHTLISIAVASLRTQSHCRICHPPFSRSMLSYFHCVVYNKENYCHWVKTI